MQSRVSRHLVSAPCGSPSLGPDNQLDDYDHHCDYNYDDNDDDKDDDQTICEQLQAAFIIVTILSQKLF